MMSTRTKELRKKRNIFFVLSTVMWVGITVFSVVSVFVCIASNGNNGLPIFSNEFKHLLLSVGITGVIGLVAAIFIKDKLRTAIWMLSLCLCTAIYKEAGMYSVLGCWLIDEYVFTALTRYYHTRLVINKEIDLRE